MNCGFLPKAALLAASVFTLTACGDESYLSSQMPPEVSSAIIEAISVEEESTEPTTADPSEEVFKLDISIKKGESFPKQFVLEGFNAILQRPELPTGCEVTALCEDLNYLGFDIDKVTLADEFMPMDDNGLSTMYHAYIGNPKVEEGFGCYAPVIVQTADDYFASLKSPCYAVDLTGRSLKELLYQVAQGRPVIVWNTVDMIISEPVYWWTTAEGEDMLFNDFQHCVVICGYDFEENTVHVADPLAGNVKRDMDLFNNAYEHMGRQAVVICGDSQTKGKYVELKDKPQSPFLSLNQAERRAAEQTPVVEPAPDYYLW